MKEALLLVFANKQDIPGGLCRFKSEFQTIINHLSLAMSPQEVQERLKLNQLKDKIWFVVPSCATTGEGLFEGLVIRICLTYAQWAWLTALSGLAVQQR